MSEIVAVEKNSEKDQSTNNTLALGLGITKNGEGIAILGTKDNQIAIKMGTREGRMIGMIGLLSSLIPSQDEIKPRVKTYRSYHLLPLNFSKYTNEKVYVNVWGDEVNKFKNSEYRPISEKFVNKNLILIGTHVIRGMTTGGYMNDLDFENPDNTEWYEYSVVTFDDFNRLSKVIQKRQIWFHKFDNISPKREDGKKYRDFDFMRTLTDKHGPFLCKEESNLRTELNLEYLKWSKEKGDKSVFDYKGRNPAYNIYVEEDIEWHIEPVESREIFDFDSPAYDFGDSEDSGDSEGDSEKDGDSEDDSEDGDR